MNQRFISWATDREEKMERDEKDVIEVNFLLRNTLIYVYEELYLDLLFVKCFEHHPYICILHQTCLR